MDPSIADKFGLLQSGNQAEYPRLFGEFHAGLKSHHIIVRGGQVILSQLYHRVRAAVRCAGRSARPASWGQTEGYRDHAWPVPQSADILQRKPPFQNPSTGALRPKSTRHKSVVFLAVHRAIQVVILALAVSRRCKDDGSVDRVGFENRGKRIVIIKVGRLGKLTDRRSQRF